MPEMIDGGVLMTLKEFTESCESGVFIDDDGYGIYAFKESNSIVITELKIFPSDVFYEGSINKLYPYIIWYNR